jgi:hypothetical protein
MTKQIEIEESDYGTSQLFIKDKFLETVKVKGDFADDEFNNSLRVYCTMSGFNGSTAFNIQFRTYGNLHHGFEKSTAKDSQYVSTMQLSINDLEKVLAYMKKEELRHGYYKDVEGKQVWVKGKSGKIHTQ